MRLELQCGSCGSWARPEFEGKKPFRTIVRPILLAVLRIIDHNTVRRKAKYGTYKILVITACTNALERNG